MSFRNDRMKEARLRKGSQREVAERLGVKQPQLAAWENGTFEPRPEMLARIAEVLEVSSDWLLGLTDHTAPQNINLSPEEHEVISLIRKGMLPQAAAYILEMMNPSISFAEDKEQMELREALHTLENSADLLVNTENSEDRQRVLALQKKIIAHMGDLWKVD